MSSNREILIYYNRDSSSDRKTVAHAQAILKHVKTYTFQKSPANNTEWCKILKALNVHPKELMNKAHPYYQANIRGREFQDEDWYNVLRRNPDIIKAPIAVRGNKVVFCLSPTDIYRLAQV
jgi:arsenate reductase